MTQDEKDKSEEPIVAEQPKTENMADWSTDFFPTSAKKVFTNLGLMLFGIIILILLSNYFSDDEEEVKKVEKPKKQAADIFSPDEDR